MNLLLVLLKTAFNFIIRQKNGMWRIVEDYPFQFVKCWHDDLCIMQISFKKKENKSNFVKANFGGENRPISIFLLTDLNLNCIFIHFFAKNRNKIASSLWSPKPTLLYRDSLIASDVKILLFRKLYTKVG